jgi:hypothetical protein
MRMFYVDHNVVPRNENALVCFVPLKKKKKNSVTAGGKKGGGGGSENFFSLSVAKLMFHLLHTLLERDVHAWTLQMSTHEHRQKWTFVKQILIVHAYGPRRRPRVDIAKVHDKVHLWTSHKVPTEDPKKEILFF